MTQIDSYRPGRHLIQVPGPTNVPPAVLAALARPTLDHRGPEFAKLTLDVLDDLRTLFGTTQPVVIYAGSGTGAWEAAISNTLSAGEKVLSVDTGHFATLWAELAREFGLEVEVIETDWRRGVDPEAIEARLAADADGKIRAVFITHNETSTGATSDVAAVRSAIDRAEHPALLFVDAVSGVGSIEYYHDAWGVDVTIAGSQKGLMMPPGLGFTAVSERALDASTRATLPCGYWKWGPILKANEQGMFPHTPATNMIVALRAALDLIGSEGLPAIWARHLRHARATRAAVAAWGLGLQCADAAAYSPTVTAVVMPEGHREEDLRRAVHEAHAMALGAGLGRLAGRVFRIGHLGDLDDLTLIGALGAIELALEATGVPFARGGVQAALGVLAER